jgi:hypothetical protein
VTPNHRRSQDTIHMTNTKLKITQTKQKDPQVPYCLPSLPILPHDSIMTLVIECKKGLHHTGGQTENARVRVLRFRACLWHYLQDTEQAT